MNKHLFTNKKGIVYQLFLSTSVLLLLINIVGLFLIKIIFPDFHRNWIDSHVKSEISQMEESILKGEMTYSKFISKQSEFFSKYNSKLEGYLNDEDYRISLWYNQKWWTLTLQNSADEVYRLVLNDYQLNNYTHEFIPGITELYVSGDRTSTSFLKLNFYTHYSDTLTVYPDLPSDNQTFRGRLKFISKSESSPQEKYIYSNSLDYISYDNFYQGQLLSPLFKDSISISPNQELTLVTMAPMNRVDVFVSSFSNFYKYFFLISAVVSLFFAFLYSKYLSKPILQINKLAKRMATLDFTHKATIKSNNELGELSLSLNTLSEKLESALTDLQGELDKKIEQEQIRKDFVANVSHELKTPLSVMKCYLDMIRDNINPAANSEYYDVVDSEIRRMNKLVLQMLQLSRVESGEQVLIIKPFNLKGLIADSVTMFNEPAKRNKLSIQYRGNFSMVEGNSEQIEQVLINLLSNAVKYSNEDSKIIVSGSIVNNKNKIEIVNYCDNIIVEDVEHFWQRFYKSDKSHNDTGTGLGLAIVSAILKLHGSSYGLIHENNKLIFYFDLPIYKKEAPF